MTTSWYTTDDEAAIARLVAAWPDAPTEREEVLGMLVETARDQVIAFADPDDLDDEDLVPLPPDSDLIPTRLVYAQLQQTINLWNAGRVSSDGDAGMDSFTFTPRPLDKTIRQLIRPKAVPSVA